MKTLELRPTRDNLIMALKEDSVNRNDDLYYFISLLNSADEAMSIALDGNWGSGKTFFVKQAQLILEAYNPFFCDNSTKEYLEIQKSIPNLDKIDLEPQVPVYYDAWSNDNDVDPILSIVFEIVKSVETEFDFKKSKDWLGIASQIANYFTGLDIKSITDLLKSENLLDGIKQQKTLHQLIDEFLESLLVEKGNRLVIFVDELDRCKPNYAVKLLERIKHYFNHDRVTFVFSINSSELQHTIKMHYGQSFDGYRYLDRFFDIKIALPKVNLKKYFRTIGLNDSYWSYDITCSTVIKYFNFELREISKFFTTAKLVAYKVTHDENSGYYRDPTMNFCLIYIVPILIGLRIYSADSYREFIGGKASELLGKILTSDNEYRIPRGILANEQAQKNDRKKEACNKLNEIYGHIFNDSETDYNEFKVGEYRFHSGLKEQLLKISNGLSNYASFDE